MGSLHSLRMFVVKNHFFSGYCLGHRESSTTHQTTTTTTTDITTSHTVAILCIVPSSLRESSSRAFQFIYRIANLQWGNGWWRWCPPGPTSAEGARKGRGEGLKHRGPNTASTNWGLPSLTQHLTSGPTSRKLYAAEALRIFSERRAEIAWSKTRDQGRRAYDSGSRRCPWQDPSESRWLSSSIWYLYKRRAIYAVQIMQGLGPASWLQHG